MTANDKQRMQRLENSHTKAKLYYLNFNKRKKTFNDSKKMERFAGKRNRPWMHVCLSTLNEALQNFSGLKIMKQESLRSNLLVVVVSNFQFVLGDKLLKDE